MLYIVQLSDIQTPLSLKIQQIFLKVETENL